MTITAAAVPAGAVYLCGCALSRLRFADRPYGTKALDRADKETKNTATLSSNFFRGVFYRMRNALKGAMT